jgi:hypothetical protein
VCHMRALPRCCSWYGTDELEGVAGFPSSVEGAASLDFSAPRHIWDQYAGHTLARAPYTPGCRSHSRHSYRVLAPRDFAGLGSCGQAGGQAGQAGQAGQSRTPKRTTHPRRRAVLSPLGLRMPCPVLLREHWANAKPHPVPSGRATQNWTCTPIRVHVCVLSWRAYRHGGCSVVVEAPTQNLAVRCVSPVADRPAECAEDALRFWRASESSCPC